MAAFEIRVNGKRRFIEEGVRAITLVADSVPNGKAERVYLHVGIGDAGEYEVQYLGGDLRPGDDISIRVLAEDETPSDLDTAPDSCSFCGSDRWHINSLVEGGELAICEGCLGAFQSVITRGVALPLGASIQDQGDGRCGFCNKATPELPALFVRNAAAICPECLRACIDLIRPVDLA